MVFNKDLTTYDTQNGSWQLEFQQRNALQAAAKYEHDDDIVIIGDLDEIPDPAVLKKISKLDEPVSLSMVFHNYFMNCRNSKKEKIMEWQCGMQWKNIQGKYAATIEG